MFKCEIDILQAISGQLSAFKGILKAVAYGSRVRGDNRGDSDLDVLIIVNKKNRKMKDKILDIFYSYELNTDMSFSVTILSLEELKMNETIGSPFIDEIKKEGIVFYDSKHKREKKFIEVPA